MLNINSNKQVVTTTDITETDEKESKLKKQQKETSKDAPITRTELRSVLKAMDKDGFNTLMDEYIQEISDPKNVKEQNEFLLQSEKTKDLPANVKLAKPNIGFVLKSEKKQISKSSMKSKIFINLCSLQEVPKPEETKHISGGSSWSLPYLVNKPRNDMDSKKRHCQTFDVIFNPLAFELSKKYIDFKKFMCDNAIKGINSNILSALKEEASMDYCLVSKYDYKGEEVSLINVHGLSTKEFDNKKESIKDYKTNLMKEIDEKKNKEKIEKENKENEENNINEFDQVDVSETKINNINKMTKPTTKTPEYKIKYSNEFEMHKLFYNPGNITEKDNTKIIIELFLIQLTDKFSISEVELEIKEGTLILKAGDIYDCSIQLKSDINEDSMEAKWDKSKKILTVTGILKTKDIQVNTKIDDDCEYIKADEEQDKQIKEPEEIKHDDIDVIGIQHNEEQNINNMEKIQETSESIIPNKDLTISENLISKNHEEENVSVEPIRNIETKPLITEIPLNNVTEDNNTTNLNNTVTSLEQSQNQDIDDTENNKVHLNRIHLIDFYNSKIFEIE